jgi:hypothetical protein
MRFSFSSVLSTSETSSEQIGEEIGVNLAISMLRATVFPVGT